ncbi:MAG: hypothetical protein ABSC50_09955 [Candidatus Bathyarchaeia archaeon]
MIIHVGNTAGVASTLAKYQRKLGHSATVVVRQQHPFGFEEEYEPSLYRPILRFARADVVHYHSPPWITSMLNGRIRSPDVALMRAIGKKVIFHYHGSEVRGRHVKPAFASIVSTPDLLEWVADAKWIPNPVDFEMFKPTEVKHGEEFVIGFYGGDQVNCPRDVILTAVNALIQRGHRILLVEATSTQFAKMPGLYAKLDLWIDKLGGFYGLSAAEAMACKIPVMANVSKVKHFLASDPFIHTSIETFTADLERVAGDASLRHTANERGAQFVRDVHDPIKVAQAVLDLYESI